jgi:cell division protein FtsI (penicillin-binding protein 3)
MAKSVARIVALQVTFGIGLVLVLGRSAWLQLVRGREFSRTAEKQRLVHQELPARRGTIFDRNGTRLVISEEKYHLQFAVNEVRDTVQLKRLAVQHLRLPAVLVDRMFRKGASRHPWFNGPWTAPEVARIRKLHGVHLIPVYSRAYPSGRLAGAIIGSVAGDSGRGTSGLERSLDSVLAGTPGLTVNLRDAAGRQFESPERLIREPVQGNDVFLTIDAELQEIAERALVEALTEFKAVGGDVVFLDHKSGEILAVASRTSAGGAVTASAFTVPFEPGSTAKPFTAAALLTFGKVKPDETVSAAGGKWTYVSQSGRYSRDVNDTHIHNQPLTLAGAVQVSSNIAVAKFSLRLRPEEQYDMLRAFGFGAPTGVEFPSEAATSIVRPHNWREGQEGISMAIGYRFAVTPMQLASAYGVFANDGILMAPTLVRSIRDIDGVTLYQHQPEVVRRVLTPEVAARIREFLAEAASDSGTGSQAQLSAGLLGKTGTARIAERGVYMPGKYRASFAAIFPARDPQLVAVVSIDQPGTPEYYGGLIAAPVTRKMLLQALSARKSVLDRGALADAHSSGDGSTPPARPPRRTDRDPARDGAAAVRLPVPVSAPARAPYVAVPEVSGKALRPAILALHQRGFRVRVEGVGRVVRSVPSAGDSLPAGKTVVIYASRPGTP